MRPAAPSSLTVRPLRKRKAIQDEAAPHRQTNWIGPFLAGVIVAIMPSWGVALFNYANTDSVRTRIDAIRLANEIEKAQNDLSPLVDHGCIARKLLNRFYRVDCTFTNKGVHRVRIEPDDFSFADAYMKPIPATISSVVQTPPNVLSANRTGVATYDLMLTDAGQKMDRAVVQIRFKVYTEPRVVERLRENAKGYASDIDLYGLSREVLIVTVKPQPIGAAPASSAAQPIGMSEQVK